MKLPILASVLGLQIGMMSQPASGNPGENQIAGLTKDKFRNLGNGLLELDIPTETKVLISSKALAPDPGKCSIRPSEPSIQPDWQWGMRN